ncbi:MAG TPA: imidazolonepropionase [Planctomycetota bacterium]|jgi:imidazolonepropionase
MHADLLIRNVQLATLESASAADAYGTIRKGALAVSGARISWLGPEQDLPASISAAREIDGEGGCLTPGLIDCHTHLVYAGNRVAEFEQRLQGASYEEIARAGGGILATVAATREATEDQLLAASLPRLDELLAAGLTTVEVKSGYGLNLACERKMLRVARQMEKVRPVRVVTTFLGAHTLPPEFAGRPDEYLDLVIAELLPVLHTESLIDAVDAFCETIGFSPAQTRRLFAAAQRLGLPVKLHAEQLSDQGGAALVADFRGLSADHLEWLSPAGIEALARAGTVAVLLPGASYFLRQSKRPPISELRAAGVPMAVATDCNPGTSPLTSLPLAMNMACTLFGLTPAEALAGTTRHAARALGILDQTGTLTVGKEAHLALWAINQPAELAYHLGYRPLRLRVFGGKVTHVSSA